MTDSVVDIRDLDFSYGDLSVLQDVRLTVPERDFASIVGPNGSGKTTLLKLLLGLLTPDRGRVRVFGKPPRQARAKLGYVPQYARYDPQFPVTVGEVALMGRLNVRGGLRAALGWYSHEDRQAALQALEEVRLGDLADRPFSELSGGQRQRVLIARALAGNPELLLLDEPTANVDHAVEQKLMDLLQDLNARLTIIMVSHDLGVVSRNVKSVICLGKQVVKHPTSEFTGEMIREMYGEHAMMVRHDQHDHAEPQPHEHPDD